VYDDIYDAISPDESLEDAMRKAREIFNNRRRAQKKKRKPKA
jgi:hypothetical protein